VLPVTVTVTTTMTAMATGVKAAYASRSCIATKVRRAMFATIAATSMLLVFLLLLVFIMLMFQDIRTYRASHKSSDRTEGTATKLVTNEGPSSTTEECGAKTTFSISWLSRCAWLTVLAWLLLSVTGPVSRRSSILMLGGIWRVSTVFTIWCYLVLVVAALRWRIGIMCTWRW